MPLRWADATYVYFPLAELPTYYLRMERLELGLLERAYKSLVAWMAKALAEGPSRL